MMSNEQEEHIKMLLQPIISMIFQGMRN